MVISRVQLRPEKALGRPRKPCRTMKNGFSVLKGSGIDLFMDTDALRIFAAAARRGSFSAAASDVGLSAVSVARRISALEKELGVPLLVRGTRGVRPSEHGARLLGAIAPLERSLADIARLACGLRDDPTGRPVRISGTEPVIAEIVAPGVPGLQRDHPHIRLDLAVAANPVDLAGNEADIALRFAAPDGNRLRVRRLCDYSLSLYRASTLDGVAWDALPHIGYDDAYGEIAEVVWSRRSGLPLRIRTSSTRAMLALVLGGAGTALLPDVVARRHPGLLRIEAAPAVPSRTLWLLVHPDVARLTAVRTVIAWLVRTCRERSRLHLAANLQLSIET